MSICTPCTNFKPVYKCSDTLEIGTIPQGQYLVLIEDLTSGYKRIESKTLAEEGEVTINISDLASDHTYRVQIEVLGTQAVQDFTIGDTSYSCGEFILRAAVGDVQEEQILHL